jgi:hypothetical protein
VAKRVLAALEMTNGIAVIPSEERDLAELNQY